MLRRSAVAFIWFWGLWATGSTLEFFGLLPMWPFLLAAVAIAAWAVLPHQHVASRRDVREVVTPTV